VVDVLSVCAIGSWNVLFQDLDDEANGETYCLHERKGII
jgi:hypothetical protein